MRKYDLEKLLKCSPHYQYLCAQAAQQTLRGVAEAFKSYKELSKKYRQGNLHLRPRPPKYRKPGGRATITYPRQALRLKDRQIRFPLGLKVKAAFGVDSFTLRMPGNLNFADIKEVRILPRNRCFYAEFVYAKEVEQVEVNPDKFLSIDTGIDNWLACVTNVGTSFIVDGKQVKSLNRFYNKRVSTLKEGKTQGFWSKRLALITEKRNRQIRDAINKAARIVVNHCLYHDISTIIFGWNEGQR